MNKKFLTLIMLASFLTTPLSAMALDPNTVPNLNGVINGKVDTESWGLNATVGSGKTGEVGQFDWNTFNLGSNKQVNWAFTGVSQTALNRVLDGNMSQIYGKLTNSCANPDCASTMNSSKVILINPNGILFGGGSSVNLNSFTASTFDAKGAKNIKDMTGSELTNYKNTIDSKFGPDVKITFASTTDKIGSLIKMDGANVHADKTLIVLAKDIEVKNGSVISTTLGYNYNNGTQSFSNAKLIASDGADVTYQKNGYANNGDVIVKAGKAATDYTINIGNDTSSTRNDMKSGSILIRNAGTTANSNINIKGTDIEGHKLMNSASGDITVWADNKVNTEDVRLETVNTYEVGSQATKNTYAQTGGRITIYGDQGVDLKNTKITSAHSTSANDGGNVTVSSIYGDVKMSANSEINSYGNATVEALKNVALSDTIIRAKNRDTHPITGAALNSTKDVLVKAHQGSVSLDNTRLAASNNVTVDAATTNTIKGGSVYAAKALNIYGQNTTLENTRLGYNDLSLYKKGATAAQDQINNVTVKGTTTFDDRKVTDGSLTLTASGNFTADNATLKRASLDYFTAGTSSDNTAVTLNSNTGNVSFVNGSNVKATSTDITANALNGSVNVLNSKLDANRDVVLNAKNSFVAGTNINSSSDIKAGRTINVTVSGQGSDIVLDRQVLDKLVYNNRLKLNADRDIKLSSTSGLAIDRADLNAGRNNEISAASSIGLSHSTLKAADNKITATNGGGVSFDTVTAEATNATTVTADCNVTTADVTKALDLKGTKLVVNTQGDINLALAGSNNANAGLRAEGRNVTLTGVNGSIGYTGGDIHSKTLTPTTNTANANLSIDRIVSNKLNLNADNKFIASNEAYIEVKDYGGFNMDSTPEFVYNADGSYNTHPFYNSSTNQGQLSTGDDGYKQHNITLSGDNFTLVYERPTGAPCPPEPPVLPDDETNLVRLPLQNEFAGQGQVVNNLTDVTANIVAAAAGIVLTDEQKEDEYTLETY